MKNVLAQIDQIIINPFQPATGLDMEKVREIAESLKQFRDNGTKGLHQVPVARQVNGHYELAFGRHRYEAFKQLSNAGDIFFADMPLLVQELSDEDMYAVMLSENINRRGISLVEIGEIFHDYMTKFKKTSVECAKRFGRTEEYVRSATRMLGLPEEGRQALTDGRITVTIGRDLLTVKKLAGEASAKAALFDITNDNFDSPKDAITNVLRSEAEISELPARAEWLTAKKFPVKFLEQQGQQKIMNLLIDLFNVKPTSAEFLEELRTLSARMIDNPGAPVKAADFPLLSQHEYAFERAVAYASLPACTACPVHAVVDGDHYCGFKACATRKQEAWNRKETDDKAKALGIKLYVNKAEEGEPWELNPNLDADKKLFADRHADLRLIQARHPVYWNFKDVPSSLRVVVVGETAKKRREADQVRLGNTTHTATGEKLDPKTAEQLRKKVELEREIHHLVEQAIDRFQWEVAAPVFGSVLDGIGSPVLLEFILEHMIDCNRDADFPEGSDDEFELIEQAKKMKKADQLRMYRRLIMFHTFYNRVAFHGAGDYGGIVDAKQPITKLTEVLTKIADDWGIKTGAAFTKAAEKYQAELDAAIKELKAKK